MSCDDIRDLLPAYAGGELSDEERAVTEEHLAACASCSRELDGFREARAGRAMLRDETPPPGSWKSVWSGVQMELFPRPPSRSLVLFDHALRYAAVLLVGIVLGAMAYLVAVPEVPGVEERIASPETPSIRVVTSTDEVQKPVVPVGGPRFQIRPPGRDRR